MPKRHGQRTKRKEKSLPEPWIRQCEPWNYWPTESLPQEPSNQLLFQYSNQYLSAALNQLSSEPGLPLQHASQNVLPPEIWSNQQHLPLIQELPVQINNISGRSVIPIEQKMTTPSHLLSEAPLLSTLSGEPYNSGLSESDWSTTSYPRREHLQSSAPLLSTPSNGLFNSHRSKSGRSTSPYRHTVTSASDLRNRAPSLSTPNHQPFNSPLSKSGRNISSYRHTVTPPSDLRNRAHLLSTPNHQPFNSPLSKSGRNTSSYRDRHTGTSASDLRNRAPSLSTPNQQPFYLPHSKSDRSASPHRHTMAAPSRLGSVGPLLPIPRDKPCISNKRSPTLSNQCSQIHSRKVKFDKYGKIKIHVRSAEDEEEKDIEYLYTVNNKKRKLVECIDLSEDLQTSEEKNSSTSIGSNSKAKKVRFAK